MSWSKDEPRGYHHGNLREALIRAALELIAKKGTAGFTFAEAARFAGVSPAAPYRHFRDRDELMASVALRGFEQFEAALARAWDDGRPDAFVALDRLGKAYLEFARSAAGVLLGDVRSRRSGRRRSGAAGSQRTRLRGVARRRRNGLRRDARGRPPAGLDGRAPHLGHGARRRVAVRTRRRRATRDADVAGGTSGSALLVYLRGLGVKRRGRMRRASLEARHEAGALAAAAVEDPEGLDNGGR